MEAISLPLATIIIQILGLPGLVFIIWHFDNKRDQRKDELRQKENAEKDALRQKEIAEREKSLALTLNQYRDDIGQIKRLYENNVYLVKNYETTCTRLEQLYSETISVISLNTQTQAHLVDSIKHNRFCPAARQE